MMTCWIEIPLASSAHLIVHRHMSSRRSDVGKYLGRYLEAREVVLLADLSAAS